MYDNADYELLTGDLNYGNIHCKAPIGTSVRRSSGCHSGGRLLAMT